MAKLNSMELIKIKVVKIAVEIETHLQNEQERMKIKSERWTTKWKKNNKEK